MKIELSDYFKNQGFRSAYLFTNNMGRRCVELVHSNKKPNGKDSKRFISYAKYLWISYNNKEVPFGYEVDHINGNGKDDRIQNLQVISKLENIIKEKVQNNKLGNFAVELTCPVCGKVFTKRLALVKKCKAQPCCCSQKCSGYLHSNLNGFNRESYIKDCEEKAHKISNDKLTKRY